MQGNDPDNVKPGGEIVEAMTANLGVDKVQSVEFPDMQHGWTVRGPGRRGR